MFRSYKFWLFITGVLLLLLLVWVFLFRHSAPSYAKYIPKDALGVLTINSKRLASDFLLSGEWKKDTAAAARKTIEKWTRAVERNGGAGVSVTSDILFFSKAVAESHQLYFGAVVRVDDENRLKNFISKEMPGLLDTVNVHTSTLIDQKTFRSLFIANDNGGPVWLGFNQEVLIVLIPSSNDPGAEKMDRELRKLFSLSVDGSVLADKNFINSEKEGADVSLWGNFNHPELKNVFHTSSDSANAPGYVNAWLNFSKGVIELKMTAQASQAGRKAILVKTKEKSDFLNYTNPDKLLGLVHVNMNLKNLVSNLTVKGSETKLDRMFESMGLSSGDVTSSVNGEADIAWEGYVHYQEKYIAYERDENFNQREVERFRDARMPAFTMRVNIDPARAASILVPKLVAGNKISPYKSGFKLNSGLPVYLFPKGNMLYLTTSENPPGDKRNTGNNLVLQDQINDHALYFYLPVQVCRAETMKEFHLADRNPALDMFDVLSITSDEDEAGKTTVFLKVTLKDKQTNALAQIARLGQEIQKKK